MLHQITIIFNVQAAGLFVLVATAGFGSGNARQRASSGRRCRSAVTVACCGKLPLQSLPVRAQINLSFQIKLFLIYI
jgi:hypothetical protein